MIKIYFFEDSERVEIESRERGCRLGVLVEVDGCYYQPIINTIERLNQEVKSAFENGEIYDIDPCQIIVKEATKNEIISTIIELDKQEFFSNFCPINLTIYDKIDSRLSNIENWNRVY